MRAWVLLFGLRSLCFVFYSLVVCGWQLRLCLVFWFGVVVVCDACFWVLLRLILVWLVVLGFGAFVICLVFVATVVLI